MIHIYPVLQIQSPETHLQLCSRNPAVVSFSSPHPSGSQRSLPTFFPPNTSQPPASAGIHCEHSSKQAGEPANEDFATPSSPPNPILELHPYFYNKITAIAILPPQTTSGNPPDLPFLTTLSTLVALFQAPTPEFAPR